MRDAAGELDADTRRCIDDFLDREIAEYDAPGASVAVFDADGVLYAEGYGARTIDPVEPATPDSLFHVASVTKSFTAMAVLQFVEDGDLVLGDPVGDHVDFLGDAPGDPITVGELLAHTSGIPSDVGFFGGIVADEADCARRVGRLGELRLVDRERLMYVNKGYVVLAAVVEALVDRPFAEHVTEALLEPMGMARSTFDQDAVETSEDAMEGYAGESLADLDPASQGPVEYPALRLGLEGPGGLLSTVTDLAAVGPLLLDEGRVGGEQVVAPETVEAMTALQGPPAPTTEGHDLHVGYGWLLEDLMGETLVYTGGGMPGYGTFVGVLPGREVGVALGVNHAAVPKIDVGMGALAVACGEEPEEVVGWYRARTAVDVAAGTYVGAIQGRTATVEPAAESGLLSTKVEVTLGDGDVSFRAAPEGDDLEEPTFATVLGNGFRWTVEFIETDDGRVMVLTRGHRAMRFDER